MLSSSLNDYVNDSRDSSAVKDGSGANINIDYTTTKKVIPEENLKNKYLVN